MYFLLFYGIVRRFNTLDYKPMRRASCERCNKQDIDIHTCSPCPEWIDQVDTIRTLATRLLDVIGDKPFIKFDEEGKKPLITHLKTLANMEY